MYLREVCWWNEMKGDTADFMAMCPNFQLVEVKHQKLGCMTQDNNITIWKWEVINMDFIISLHHIHKQHDSIWVIFDRVTKSARFLTIKTTDLMEKYPLYYIN